MEVVKSQDQLSSIESSSVFAKPDLIAEMIEELSAIKEICDEIESLWRLESKVQFDDKWVIDQRHDVSLRLCVLHLICLDDEVFFERLHGKDLAVRLSTHHVYFAKASSPNNF